VRREGRKRVFRIRRKRRYFLILISPSMSETDKERARIDSDYKVGGLTKNSLVEGGGRGIHSRQEEISQGLMRNCGTTNLYRKVASSLICHITEVIP